MREFVSVCVCTRARMFEGGGCFGDDLCVEGGGGEWKGEREVGFWKICDAKVEDAKREAEWDDCLLLLSTLVPSCALQ